MRRFIHKQQLAAKVHVIMDEIGRGRDRRSVRRAVLLNSQNGLLHELPTVYVYREQAQRSLNTHRATLRDLAFYLEWVWLKIRRDRNWVTPEERVSRNQLALTRKEIDDLCRWCQQSASHLARIRRKETATVSGLPAGETVNVATTNSRLRNICNYLVWLTEDSIEGVIATEGDPLAKSEKYKEIIRASFERNLNGTKKGPPVLSLDEEASKAFLVAIGSSGVYPNTVHGNRDRLIARLLHESGLRAGELLKLQCADISASYEVRPGKRVGLVKVIRRPNDPADDRKIEPAVKTLPGPVTISSTLANDIVRYITNERRIAIDRRVDRKETPYLFVCHSGQNIGKPISQRNLNRIVAKLKRAKGLPEWLAPHVLRHTHFTQMANIADKKGQDATDVLLLRGRWAPNSKMVALYTQRHLISKAADLVEERDRMLGDGKRD